MYRRPAYGQGDSVWVNRAGAQLEGIILGYQGIAMYRVAVAGQGMKVIQESAMSPRTEADKPAPGPEED